MSRGLMRKSDGSIDWSIGRSILRGLEMKRGLMMRWMGIGIIGLLGGLASGLFGVGGGILFVPLLALFLNYNFHLAIGTSLLAIVPTALVGAWRHISEHSVDFRTAILLALFAMIGAWLGAGLSLRLDVTLLRKLFAVLLLILAFRLFFKP